MVSSYERKYGIMLIVIILLMVMVVIAIGCEESRGNIEGRVFNEDGMPIAKAIIRAEKGGYPSVL